MKTKENHVADKPILSDQREFLLVKWNLTYKNGDYYNFKISWKLALSNHMLLRS